MPINFTCNNILPLNKNCGNKKMFGGGNKKKGLVTSVGRPIPFFSIISKKTSGTKANEVISSVTLINFSYKIDNVDLNDIPTQQKISIINNVKEYYANLYNIDKEYINVKLIQGSTIVDVRLDITEEQQTSENNIVDNVVTSVVNNKNDILSIVKTETGNDTLEIDDNYEGMNNPTTGAVNEEDLDEIDFLAEPERLTIYTIY